MNNTSLAFASSQTSERRGYNDVETARILGVSPATLRRWRLNGKGVRYRKLSGSGCVRYFIEDIEAYIKDSPCGGGTGKTEAA